MLATVSCNPDGMGLTSDEPVSVSFVALRDVAYAYEGAQVPALAGLGMTVGRGEFVAIVGPSGCGKSTLLRLIAGLALPQSGTVAVAGDRVSGPVTRAGMVFQAPTLLPWRTALENVLLPLELAEPFRSRLIGEHSAWEAEALGLLASLGLGGAGALFPRELSGGMQMRVALCRALIHAPALLLLDEPLGALDALTREDLWGVVRDLHAARGTTVVLVTHDLREAVFLADRVLVMSPRPGRIVAERRIALPEPRELEVTFTPAFQATVQDLRRWIRRTER